MTYGVWKVISAFKIDGNDDEKDSKRLLSAIKKAAESRKLNFLKSKYVRETESYLSLDQMAEKQRDDDDDCDDEKEESEDPSEELLQVSESDSKSSRFEEAIASLSNRDQIFLNELSKVYFNLSDEGGNWPSWATKLCIGLAVIAICAIAVVATGGFGASCIATSMLVGAVKGAVIGAVTGAVTGAIQGAITEGIKTGSWEGALKGALSGAIDGAADGFMFGAIGGAISGAINPSYCFIAGTMVMTAVGLRRIEEIKKGDTVLAYDDNTGRYEGMPVTDTYINETEELVEINVGDETITCTPGHSFLTTKGWKKAGDLTDKDILKTLGDDQKITEVIKKKLNSKIKVYNLNVMSCHTYAVGKIGVIVHNKCSGSYELDFDNGKKYIGKGTERRMRVSINRIEKQYGVKCIRSDWTPAKTSRDGFLQEYQRMMNAEFNPSKNGLKCKDSADMEFYNIINSPGLKIWLGLK